MNKELFNSLTKGKIFTVSFVKKDKSIRVLNGIRGGKDYVKGTGKLSEKVIGVWDIKEYKAQRKAGKDKMSAGQKSFRCVIPETILSLRVNGKIYNSEGKEVA